MNKKDKNFQLDGHKLIYHSDRLGEYLNNDDCYPIYMEISPVGSCNHRCVFCAYDFIGYPNRKLEKERTVTFIEELSEAGLKSILYAGEGEPLLHPNIGEFISHTRNNGIDVGLFTNGQLLKESLAKEILPNLTFIRFSFNGGNSKTYSEIHKVSEKVFDKVIENIKRTCEIRERENLDVDLGAQFVLLSENKESLFDAVKAIKKTGIDYFVIKPFVKQSDQQGYQMEERIHEKELAIIHQNLNDFCEDDFDVQLRIGSFLNYGIRDYNHCYGTSFISAINSAGDIASCLPYWDQENYIFGNIYENSFTEIWNGKLREQIKENLEKKLDIKQCPPNCRPDNINSFLWEMKHPNVKHINFI